MLREAVIVALSSIEVEEPMEKVWATNKRLSSLVDFASQGNAKCMSCQGGSPTFLKHLSTYPSLSLLSIILLFFRDYRLDILRYPPIYELVLTSELKQQANKQ